jgi:hypothetical protein
MLPDEADKLKDERITLLAIFNRWDREGYHLIAELASVLDANLEMYIKEMESEH